MAHWQSLLERWRAAGLIDEPAAERIRAWEHARSAAARGDRLARIAFGFGGLLLAAGVLLLVAAHWDEISPALRFALVLLLVAVFHAGAAACVGRIPALATTLHAAGTAALGAGIFLAGQIFNMAEHWPGALLLWALGAAAALALLRDWPHVLWVALLAPAWLVSEWIALHDGSFRLDFAPPAAGCLLLALVYLAARGPGLDAPWRAALARLGAAAIVPVGMWLGATRYPLLTGAPPPPASRALALGAALLLPAAVALLLRRRAAPWLVPAAIWVVVLANVNAATAAGELALYVLYALAAAAVVLWGLSEQQPLTVNVGILGFALTIVFFYFASLFDKLGRSLGLIVMGIVFIGGGWLLERTRRSLVERIGRSAA